MNDLIFYLFLLFIITINISLIWGFLAFKKKKNTKAPFVPTSPTNVKRMIDFANISPKDKVYDLGCGDGRLVFAAGEKGATAIGIEISFWVYLWAKTRQYITQSPGIIRRASLWDVDIHDANIVFLYLLPPMMERFIKEKYPTLKKGTQIISNGFELKGLEIQEKLPSQGFMKGRILKYVKS